MRLVVLGQRAGRALRAAVAVGGVEEVDADLVRVIHDRFGLGGGGQRPEVHGAEAQAAYGEARTAQVDVFHTAKPSMASRLHSSDAWLPVPGYRSQPSSNGGRRPGRCSRRVCRTTE